MKRRWDELIVEVAAPGPAGSAEAALSPEEAAAVFARLDAHLVPLPTAADTAALIDRLRPLLPQPAPRRFREVGLSREPVALLLWAQLHHFRPSWWLASLGFVLVGLVAGPSLTTAGLSPAVLAPPLVIGGVLYAFRSLRGAALELELSCPVTPAQVALGRMLVPLVYDLLLGAIPVLAPGPLHAWFRLYLSWTAALILFAGLMLTLTLFVGTTVAAGLATGLWGLLGALHLIRLSPFGLPDGPGWILAQLALLASGILLLSAGLRPERIGRWAAGRQP
ncbi:hypothetical protein [Symbiobacterium terraclitae]|uniref:hypothetical protein n=1 Tax=Symbiobacterium terraclitae TaxID=557451 RepID=UPI0035B56104